MTSDLYNIDNYTDEQLYDILDMNSPSDRELEAKIIHLIRKYTVMQTESGNQLAKFFDDIYKRFFSEDIDVNVEGFDNKGKDDKLQQQNITATQNFDYAQDKLQLNPLIKQTITRVISIDSQYRDVKTSPLTTNFTFDLSEPLRDVVSLKLYSVQIPYTWYTIAKSFGSNFFYLKGVTPDITDPKYSYKIEIASGNYTPTQLISAINTSFQDISNGIAADVNFNGQQILSYNQNTSKSTINLNIQNTFNENYYALTFPAGDLSGSIAQYLGFENASYQPNSINSNSTIYQTKIINASGEQGQNFKLDNTNNYFTVIQYLASTQSAGFDGTRKILNQVQVNLLDPNNNNNPFVGNASRSDIITYIQTGLYMGGFFDVSSNIQQVNISNADAVNNGYSYFQFTLIWNRYMVKYVPNAKTIVIFPNEPTIPRQNQYYNINNTNETFSIWQYNKNATYNAFFFDNSQNQFSQITSERPYVNSTFTVDTSTNMFFTCTTPGYNIGRLNDLSLNVAFGIYSSTQFVVAISNSFVINNSRVGNIFNITNTVASIDNTNTFNLTIDMTKAFTNSDYTIVLDASSILLESNKNNTNQNYDASFVSQGTPGTTMIGNITYYTGTETYLVDNSYILTVVPKSTSSNRYAGNISIYLPWTDNAETQTYNDINDFTSAIQSAIQNVTVSVPSINDIQRPFSKSIVSYDPNKNAQGRYDLSLKMDCYYYLTQNSYDISFADSHALFSNSQWTKLSINAKYTLYDWGIGGYSKIVGNSTITSSLLTVVDGKNTFILTTNPLTPSPADTIIFRLTARTYTISQLYEEINIQLNNNPKTFGSQIISYVDTKNNNYSQFWLNVNNVYTSADYILDFWDPVSFISCFSGSSTVKNTTWDTTVGWILGFRDYTQYMLTQANQITDHNFSDRFYYLTSTNGFYRYDTTYQSGLLLTASVNLTGDTSLSTNLFNYFLISLDDYIQNHLNDGLVTITRSQTQIQNQGQQYTTTEICDPATHKLIRVAMAQADSNNTTNSKLYALNQSIQSQSPAIQQYSPGPYIKDLFGIIPIKPPTNPGDTYTEFGGSLQNQTRMYFGPVNIRKMSIQLLSDRGDFVDLNGSNWTFSFVCEQLYRSSSAGT